MAHPASVFFYFVPTAARIEVAVIIRRNGNGSNVRVFGNGTHQKTFDHNAGKAVIRS